MGLYHDHLLPWVVDLVLRGRHVQDVRDRYLEGVRGVVLDVGFGSGLNLPHLSAEVERLYGLDPVVEEGTTAHRLARPRIEQAPFPVEMVPLSGEAIPLEDDSVDFVVTTFTLCTIPKVDEALAEMRRVLRPDGSLRFVEHGRAPSARLARWQDRLNPLQKAVAGGCNLNRPMDQLIRGAGFEIRRLDNFYLSGPKIGTYLYAGRATIPQ